MIRLLALIFFLMAVYGTVVNQLAESGFCLFMVGFLFYGERQLNKRDQEFYASPAGAKSISATSDMLDRLECEASCSHGLNCNLETETQN